MTDTEFMAVKANAEEYGWVDLDALAVWYERAFNRVKSDEPDEATRLFAEEIDPRFGTVLDADALSLWGRLHKDRGDAARRDGRFTAAADEYEKAEEKYERSYRKHKDRFPGINVATLRLLRAACLVQAITVARNDTQNLDEANARRALTAELLVGSKQRAAEVLATRPWPKWLPDDDIWMAATAAEAFFLQEKWSEAEVHYRMALRPENKPLPHHADSMTAQLERLNEAFRALGATVPPPLDKPREFLTSLFSKK